MSRVILSGFADEVSRHKTAEQQFVAFAALGLQYYSLRQIDLGGGVKNAMQLTLAEIQKIRRLQNEFGLNVSSIDSTIGKTKLCDADDGTKYAYVPFSKCLGREVKKACGLAHALEAKLIRGYSFYPPKGTDPWDHLPQAVDQLGQIAEACHRADLTFGLEVESHLVGCDGLIAAEIHRQVNHPGMMLIFDAANLLSQGFSTVEVFEQYLAMRPGIGWMHIKDCLDAEEYVPADVGQGGHEAILRDFSALLPAVERKLRRRGIPGVFLDLEPCLKGGGPSGGYSGPDGMGVALRALARLLDFVGIGYHLRDIEDVQAGGC